MSSSSRSVAAPHRSDSLRSSASHRPRVHFRRGVDIHRVGGSPASPQVHRRPPPPPGSAQLQAEAAQVIQALDAARCDVSNTDRPVDNGLRQQRERQQAGYGSLSRASLRRKKNRPGLNSITTNTLPTSAKNARTLEPRSSRVDIDADKNNLIKAENLLRESKGSLLHVDGLLKRSSSQVDHLNNLNSLKEDEEKLKRSNYRAEYLDSEIILPCKPDRDSDKLDKIRDTVDNRPSDDGIRISVVSATPAKRTESSSQTSPRRSMPRGRHNDPGVESLAASTIAAMTSPFIHLRHESAPPPRPDRTPPKTSPYKPRGFSYLGGRGDRSLIEREREDSDTSQSRSVIAQSHNIIEQIRRERSRSPDGRPVRRESPPDLVVPTQHPSWMRTTDHDHPPEMERESRRQHRQRYDHDVGRSDGVDRYWSDSPEDSSRYRDDSPPDKRRPQRFDVLSPEVKTFYHTSRGPQVAKTYYQEMTPPHESPRGAARDYESDSPSTTLRSRPRDDTSPRTSRSQRYETDSSGEAFVYRDDSPGQSPNTRTYRFTSGTDWAHHQPDSSRRHQRDLARSSDGVPGSDLMQRTSSIVMIGVDDTPEPASSPSRRPGFSRLSTLVEDSLPGESESPHYQVPKYQTSPPAGQNGDKVIRISVSGSHSSSNHGSPAETRRITKASSRTNEARHRHGTEDRHRRRTDDRHSREDSPPGRRRHSETPPRHVNSSSESPRRRRGSSDPPDPANGHDSRDRDPHRSGGTLEKARQRTTRDKDSLSSRHRGHQKKRISIKFMYDDDPEQPAERLAKYTEYTGSDGALRPQSPSNQRPPSDSREGWKTDKFLTNLIEESRPEGSERRDGRRVTPPPNAGYHRKPHGVWSSRSEEDCARMGLDADYHKSHKATQSITTSRRLREDRDKMRSSVSSEEGRRRQSREGSRDRRSPGRETRDHRSPDRETRDRKSPDRETRDHRSPDRELRERRSQDRETRLRRSEDRETRDRRSQDRETKSRRSSPRRSSRDRSSSPEAGKSPKTNWLSATLSRLDLKSKKDSKDGTGKPKDDKAPNKNKETKNTSKNNIITRKDSPSDKERPGSRSVSRAGGSSLGRRMMERREHRTARGYVSSGQESSSRRRRADSQATSEERDFSSAERPQRRRARSSEERGGSELREPPPSRAGSRMRERKYFSDDSRRHVRADRPSVARTASFSRRYPELVVDETDGSRQGTVGRRSGRRVSNATDTTPGRSHRHRRRGTSSVNSSGSDAGSPAAATSHTSDRSVFLHATTVADIPPNATGDTVTATEDQPLPARELRKVHRSFSVRSPFKLQHKNDREINYENKNGLASVNGGSAGRPPRAPPTRRESRDTELEDASRERAESRSSRYSTLPKGSRTSSRNYRTAERSTR